MLVEAGIEYSYLFVSPGELFTAQFCGVDMGHKVAEERPATKNIMERSPSPKALTQAIRLNGRKRARGLSHPSHPRFPGGRPGVADTSAGLTWLSCPLSSTDGSDGIGPNFSGVGSEQRRGACHLECNLPCLRLGVRDWLSGIYAT